MRAALLQQPRQVSVVEIDDPAPDHGILLRMRAVGLCGSDLHTWRGDHPFRKPPVVLGHEGAGEVVSVPPGETRFGVGDRVAVLPALSCWECTRCEAGLAHLCAHKRVPGGGWPGMLSEYYAAPARVLVPLSDKIGFDEGAMIEPVAVAWHSTGSGGITAGESVAVLGGGAIGSLVAAVSRLRGASPVLVSDLKQHNREFLQSQGVDHVVDPLGLLAAGAEITGGEGFDVVVVASGHPRCLEEALSLCRPRGRVVLLPMFAGPLTADLNPVVLKEITIQGSTIYTPADFRAAAELVNQRVLDVRPYITDVVGLDEVPAVLTAIDAGVEHLKIQIDPTR